MGAIPQLPLQLWRLLQGTIMGLLHSYSDGGYGRVLQGGYGIATVTGATAGYHKGATA